MASRREREVIDRTDRIIRLCGTWPGLWQTHDSATPPYAPEALRHASDALMGMRHEDWDLVEQCLTAAEALVEHYVAHGPVGLTLIQGGEQRAHG